MARLKSFILYAFIFSLGFSEASFASSGITYQGRILKPNGDPVSGQFVQFRMQIKSPSPGSCLMYEEQQTIDMRTTNGLFSLVMNSGAGTRTDTPAAYNLERIFANKGSFSFGGACASGSTYTPSESDGRVLVVSFRDETMGGVWEPMPAQSINFVPFALQTKQVEGFGIRNLVRVEEVDGTLTDISPLSNSNYDALKLLVAGTSTLYQRAGQLNGVTVPTITSGHVLGWNGSAWTSVDPSAGVQTFAKTALPACAGGAYLRNNSGALECTTPAVGGGGTVTEVATGTGLTGGPINSSGTISLATLGSGGTGYKVTYDAYGRVTGVAGIAETDLPTLTAAGKVNGSAITGNLSVGTVTATGLVSSPSGSFTGLGTSSLEVFKPASTTDKVVITAPAGLTGSGYSIVLPVDAGSNGQVLTTNGSGVLSWAALPAVTSSQWTTTGSNIYYNTGNVGIGTTNPGTTLDVVGTTRSTIYRTASPSSAASPTYMGAWGSEGLFFPSSNNLGLSTAGTERLRIDGSGSVGIGTASPDATLHVVTSSGARQDLLLYNSVHGTGIGLDSYFPTIEFNRRHDGTNALALGSGYTGAFAMNPSTGQFSLITGNNPGAGNTASQAERLSVLNSGQVGVATSTPVTQLDVAGSLKIADGGETCGGTYAGALRYNTSNLSVEYCNGVGWLVINSGVSSGTTNSSTISSTSSITLSPAATQSVYVTSTVASTSHTNGALVVSGGLGVDGAINTSGAVNSTGLTVTGAGGFYANTAGNSEIFHIGSGTPSVKNTYVYGGINDTGSPSTSYGYLGAWDSRGAAAPLVLQSSGGNVGIGTTTPVSKFHLYEANTSTTGSTIANFDMGINPGSAASGGNYGVVANNRYNSSSNSTGGPRGIVGRSYLTTTATVAEAYGVSGQVQNTSTGTITGAFGIHGLAQNTVGGTMSTAVGTFAQVTNAATGGSIGNAMALQGGVNNASGATMTSSYELYLNTLNSGTITNQYGVFQASAASKNYFAGNVGIGTSSPSGALHVNTALTPSGGYAYGIISQPSVAAAVTNDFRGIYSNPQLTAGSYTVNEASSIKVGAINKGAGVTLNSAYGLFIDPITTGTNNYAIYSNTSANSYFGGNVGIGTSTPQSPLHIQKTYSVNSSVEEYGALVTTYFNEPTGTNHKVGLRTNTFPTHSSGTVPLIIGQQSVLPAGTSGGTVTDASAFWGRVDVGTGQTITNAYGLNIQNGSGASGPVNNYGLYIQGMTKGTAENYSLYAAGTSKSYFGGNLGVGITAPTSRLHVYENSAATAGFTGAMFDFHTSPASPPSASSYGLVSHMNYDSTANATNGPRGLIGRAYLTTSATVGDAFGVSGLATNSSTGTMTDAYGVYGSMNNTTTGAVGTGRGVYGYANNSSTGSMTTAIGLQGGIANATGGTIATSYEAYLSTINGGSITNQYGIYQATATSKNYFAGNVGIGTTSPVAKLDVDGAIKSKDVSNSSQSIDFSGGNYQYTSSSCGSFTINNVKPGGSYMLAVQGSAGGTCAFTAYTGSGTTGPLTVKTAGASLVQTASKHTIFTFVVMGSFMYVVAADGF